jgi:hypothetical protein
MNGKKVNLFEIQFPHLSNQEEISDNICSALFVFVLFCFVVQPGLELIADVHHHT